MNQENTLSSPEHLLILAALAHADHAARRFADDPSTVPEWFTELKTLEHRYPTDNMLDGLRNRYGPADTSFHLRMETYRLLNLIASVAALNPVSPERPGDPERARRRLEKITGFAARGMHHIRLIPDSDAFHPLVLDGASDHPANSSPNSSPDSSPDSLPDSLPDHTRLPSPDSSGTVGKDETGKYVVGFGRECSAELDIGDTGIQIVLKGLEREPSTDGDSGFQIYFNGIDADHRQAVTRTGEFCYRVAHAFEHPDLVNVTIIPGDGASDLSMIFWCGVERELIAGILERMYPDPRHRLAWWWNGIDDFDGQAPVQLIQKRQEDRVLAYLSRRLKDRNRPSGR